MRGGTVAGIHLRGMRLNVNQWCRLTAFFSCRKNSSASMKYSVIATANPLTPSNIIAAIVPAISKYL